VEVKSRDRWLIGNVVIAALALGLVVGLALLRRSSIQPIIAKEV
jgi:hypothetical protein